MASLEQRLSNARELIRQVKHEHLTVSLVLRSDGESAGKMREAGMSVIWRLLDALDTEIDAIAADTTGNDYIGDGTR